MFSTLLENWQSAFRETFESALAAGIAWWLGLLVFGGEHTPLFAAVTAIVCLAPGLPSHSKQAVGLLVGVIAGIAIGELALAVAGGAHPVALGVAVFLSMLCALGFKVQPIVGIQAGVSTVIVLVEGRDIDSLSRIIDAMIGGAVALFFSQILLTPNPFAMMRREGEKLVQSFDTLCRALSRYTDGAASREHVDKAVRDMQSAAMAHEDILEYTGRVATRTLRGRWRRQEIEGRVGQWRTVSRRLQLALGDSAHSILAPNTGQDGQGDGDELDEAARWIAAGRDLAKGNDSAFRSVATQESEDADGRD
ncbi:MAG: FUSC family protein [Alteraurantiacibacter sp.]